MDRYLRREGVDRELTGLAAAHQRLAAAMYSVDSHPGLTLLSGVTHIGQTAVAATRIQARVGALWAQFSLLDGRLTQAREIRARRGRPTEAELAELTVLLCGAVELDPAGLPVERGAAVPAGPGSGTARPPGPAGAPGGSGTARLYPAELVAAVDAGAAEVTTALDQLTAAVAEVAGWLAAITERLDAARALADDLGADQAPIQRLARTLAALSADATDDPLGAVTGRRAELTARLDELVEQLRPVRAALDEAAGVRDGFGARLARLGAAVDEVAAAEEQTARSYQVVLTKIDDPGLPPAPASAGALRGLLSALAGAGTPVALRPGHWARVAEQLADAEREVEQAGTRAARLREAADGLLGRRAELRGRLSAYRAKAARLGHGEHAALDETYGRARDLLYTSPCDLPAATRAVVAYQRAIAELAPVSGGGDPAGGVPGGGSLGGGGVSGGGSLGGGGVPGGGDPAGGAPGRGDPACGAPGRGDPAGSARGNGEPAGSAPGTLRSEGRQP